MAARRDNETGPPAMPAASVEPFQPTTAATTCPTTTTRPQLRNGLQAVACSVSPSSLAVTWSSVEGARGFKIWTQRSAGCPPRDQTIPPAQPPSSEIINMSMGGSSRHRAASRAAPESGTRCLRGRLSSAQRERASHLHDTGRATDSNAKHRRSVNNINPVRTLGIRYLYRIN